jgi:hypothetical protein
MFIINFNECEYTVTYYSLATRRLTITGESGIRSENVDNYSYKLTIPYTGNKARDNRMKALNKARKIHRRICSNSCLEDSRD